VAYLRQAGLKAVARSALPDARLWLEQAIDVLATLPESRSTLEQAFEIRLELRPALNFLGELRRTLDRLREAEAIAEKLNDERRRGRVSACLVNSHEWLGEPDEALTAGTRALAIARKIGDVDIRVLTAVFLVRAHRQRGDYEQAVALATDALTTLPADRLDARLGNVAPASVFLRMNLVAVLTALGRFADAG